MTPENIFLRFNKYFSASDLAVLIPALRQEPVVWDYVLSDLDSLLGNPLFSQISQWTPDRLSTFALGYLREGDSLEDKAHQKALNITRTMEKPVTKITGLLQAAAIAYSFAVFVPGKEIQPKSIVKAFSNPEFNLDTDGWKAVIACLPFDTTQSDDFDIEYRLHSALCHPLTDEEISVHISKSILKLETSQQVEVLRFLARNGRKNLLKLVADQVSFDQAGEKQVDLISIDDTRQKALVFQAAGDAEKAFELLEKSLVLLEQYKHQISEQQVVLHSGDQTPFNDAGNDGVGVELVLFNQALEAGDVAGARRHGQAICTRFVERAALEKGISRVPGYMLDADPKVFITQLQDIGLDQDALQVALLFLKERPADRDLLITTSSILESLGDYSSAIKYAEIAAAIDPFSTEQKRRIARLHTNKEDYEGAFDYWRHLAQDCAEVDADTWLGLATSAMQLNQFDEVVRGCEAVLKVEPENSSAHYLLGASFFNTGDFQQSLEHLNTAVYLDPENQDAWLKLAGCFELTGDSNAVLDTLRKASMSNPDSIEINYSLADGLLNAGYPSEALPYLEKCANLAPKVPDTAVKLGKTLASLGKYEDAELILAGAFQKWPDNARVASVFADVLMTAGKKFEAVKPMEVYINVPGITPEQMMDYAACLMDIENPVYKQSAKMTPEVLAKGIAVLERLLEAQPENVTAQMVLAEAVLVNGESAFAKKLYERQLEKTSSANQHRARINTGLGLACMNLGEYETAIAIFQEVTQDMHEDLFLHQKLAEAFEKVSLGDEAMQAAEYALRIAPADIDNLGWYASLSERLGRLPESISAFESAAELNPDNPVFALNTARLMIQNGEGDTARMWLDKVIQNPAMTASDYQIAAYSYLRLQDAMSGYTCLEKAVEGRENPTPEMVLEFSALARSLFGDEKALQVLSKGIEAVSATRQLLTYQADICHALKQDQQALDLLQMAKKLGKFADSDESNKKSSNTLMTTSWMESLSSEKGINARIASMFFNQGNLAAGLDVLEGMLESEPGDLAIRTKAIEAAFNLLDYSKVEKLLIKEPIIVQKIQPDDQPDVEDYLALLAEIALHLNDVEKASQLLEELIILDPSVSRVKVLQARMLTRKGDENVARIAFQNSVRSSGNDWKVLKMDEEWLAGLSTVTRSSWLSDGAIELGVYDLAVHESEEACKAQPGSLLNLLRLIQAYAYAAYTARLRSELFVVSNAVDKNILEDGITKVTAAYNKARMINPDHPIEKWYAIAMAVLQPDPENIHALLQYEPDDVSAPFYAAVFRQINNHSNAIEVCNRFDYTPEMMLHKAFCCLPTEVDQGVKSIAKAFARNPQQPLFYVVAALLADESGDTASALAEMESALRLWNNEPEWYTMAARYADVLGQPQKSLELYQRSAQFDDGSGKYILAYGYALIDAGQADDAVRVLEGVSSGLQYKEELRIALANAYLKSGNHSKAAEIAEELGQAGCATADCLILVSQLAYREGKDELALEKAQQAVSVEPQNPAAIYYSVQLLRSLERPVEALSRLEQHLQYVSDMPEFTLLHAELVYEVDGALSALPLAEELDQVNNKSLRTVKLIARVMNECGQTEKFTKVALEGLKINPGDPDLNLWLGKSQSKTGQLDQAVQHYAEAIRQTPENAEAYLELAELFQKRREEVQSIHILRKAIEAFPDDYRAYHAAGNILKEMKDYAGAEAMLRRAAELEPTNLAIRRQLGAIIALNLVHQV